MLIVFALGGNALLRRGEPMTAAAQRRNVQAAASALAPLAREHRLVISHGNGPQIGLLALQGAQGASEAVETLDVLGAQTEGMIGYIIEQELSNLLPNGTAFATVLTMVEVDPRDPAFDDPTKFIGPGYDEATANQLAGARGWAVKQDGERWRRVVPSPRPLGILEIQAIRWLLEKGAIVICAGGGGIPIARDADGSVRGVEAVVDKDLASALLSRELAADRLIMATDAPAVQVGWGTPEARSIRRAPPEAMESFHFPAGSMGPKVEAACLFARATGKPAVIGPLEELNALLAGTAGTMVTTRDREITWY